MSVIKEYTVVVPYTHKENDGEYVRAINIRHDIYQLQNYSLDEGETALYPPFSYVRLAHEDPHGNGGYMVIVEQVSVEEVLKKQ